MGIYIIKSGDGYFVRLTHNKTLGIKTPEMSSDPMVAMRMATETARAIANTLSAIGFWAELIPVTVARIKLDPTK